MTKKITTYHIMFSIVAALLVAMILWFLSAFYTTYHHGKLRPQHGPRFMYKAERNRPDPNQIQPWMTFEYINKVFGLPDGYLQHSLGISSSHYPHEQISDYAHKQNLDKVVFISDVKNEVQAYQPEK